jgi:hypothetical protein
MWSHYEGERVSGASAPSVRRLSPTHRFPKRTEVRGAQVESWRRASVARLVFGKGKPRPSPGWERKRVTRSSLQRRGRDRSSSPRPGPVFLLKGTKAVEDRAPGVRSPRDQASRLALTGRSSPSRPRWRQGPSRVAFQRRRAQAGEVPRRQSGPLRVTGSRRALGSRMLRLMGQRKRQRQGG